MPRTRPVANTNDAADEAEQQRAAPHIDDSQLLKPLLLTLGHPATLTVNVSGVPPPIVQWLVGRRRVKETARYQMRTEGERHTLSVSKVPDNMGAGVHVVARNDVGEDSCKIDIRIVDENENNDDDNRASLVNHAQQQQQQQQQLNGIANDAEIITNTAEKADDTANVSRDSAVRRSIPRRRKIRVRGDSDSKSLNMSLDTSTTQDKAQKRVNATEDLSVPKEAPASLDRSYETGRRTRSAAAAARRTRIRAASSTSSMPAATTHVAGDRGDQKMAGQDGSSQASDTLEVPEKRVNAAEEMSVPTETAASLDRSYETGRQTRSAAAAARRTRIRAASSTSSMPAATTHVADDDSAQRMAGQDGSAQASNTLGAPEKPMNAKEDVSVPKEALASLDRSYESGRRTRSAAASARRTRIRAASSTSSMPATTTHVADDGGDQKMAGQDGSSQASDTLEVPEKPMNATQDVSVPKEAPASLDRSYETGKRTRSAAAAARRTRIRAASSTSSVPAATTHVAHDDSAQRMAGQDGSSQASDTSGLLGRRRRRRRPDTGKVNTSLPAEAMQLTLSDDRPAKDSFAAPADSNLLDLGSPRNTETVKTKKRMRRKPKDSAEASTDDQELEPDLTVSQDFSQSFEMRTSSPVETFSFKAQPVADTTENKAAETERDPNLWMMCDTRLNDLCKRLLADQNFDKPRETQVMKVEITDETANETANISRSKPATKSPLQIKSDENEVSTTMLPVTSEMPVRRKTAKRRKQVEDIPAEQQADDRRLSEDSSQVSAKPEDSENRNVSNILSFRKTETRESELLVEQETDELMMELNDTENRNVPNVDEFVMESDDSENRNVPNVLSAREAEAYIAKVSKDKKRAEGQTTEAETTVSGNRNVPNTLCMRKAAAEPLSESAEVDSRVDEDSSQLSTEPDTIETDNKNVPNTLCVRESESYTSKLAKLTKVSKDKERVEGQTTEAETAVSGNRNVPNTLCMRKAAAEPLSESAEVDSRVDEDSSQLSTEPDTIETDNKNVPNTSCVRESESYRSKLAHIENVRAENDNRLAMVGPTIVRNRNVSNISCSQEVERVSSPSTSEASDEEQTDVVGMPYIIPPGATREQEIQIPDAEDEDEDYDIISAEEVKSLKREMENEKLRQEQQEKEKLEKEEQEQRDKEIEEQQAREREKSERVERKRQEREEKERRKRERKERKEVEKRQRETPVIDSNEQQVPVDDIPKQTGSPTLPTRKSRRTKETVDVKCEEPQEILQPSDNSQQVPSKAVKSVHEKSNATEPYDPYANIPMVDDIADEENIPPADDTELTPTIEKSAKKKPPSGRKMPPRSPLFPAPVVPKPGDEQNDSLTFFRVTPPRTTLKEVKARDRESSVRQRSRSADRMSQHDRGQTRRTGSHFTVVDIDIESEPGDSIPPSLSMSFDGGRPFSASSPIPPDLGGRRTLRPARSEEMLFVKKLSYRSPTPSQGSNDSSLGLGDGGQWLRAAKSTDCLNRSIAGSEFSEGLGRRSISREWQVVTTTTKEEIVFVKRPDEDAEERRRIKSEYEKNKQVREINEERLTKERKKVERERLERLLAELKRRRQKERQQLLEKKMAEKQAKKENDQFIRQAIKEQRQKRLEEDRVRREEEQKKRDEMNEKWRKDREQRERVTKEKQQTIERERQETLEIERQLQLHREEKERQEREKEERRKKELQEKREKEGKARRETEEKEKLEQERQKREKLTHEEKLRLEQTEKEAKLLREKMELERIDNEARMREEEENRLEKEREIMEKLAEDHSLKLKRLEEETRLQQEQLEKERLEKEKEIMRRLEQEHKLKLRRIEEETRLQQEQLERERLEKEALDKIIQQQKLRLEQLEREEKLRAEKQTSPEHEDDRRKGRGVYVSATEKSDKVFADEPSSTLLSPTSPVRPRLTSQDMATQTDDHHSSSPPATVVGQVRHYPAHVITERLVSDSESPAPSPVPDTDDPTAIPPHHPASSPAKRRAKSVASADFDENTPSSVVIHEYSELLSFWRADPTDGRLTRARANFRRAASEYAGKHATVHDFDLPPEQWTSNRSDSADQPPNDDEDDQAQAKSRPTPNLGTPAERARHQGDDGDDPPASAAADDLDIGEKSFVHSTLSWVGSALLLLVAIVIFYFMRRIVGGDNYD